MNLESSFPLWSLIGVNAMALSLTVAAEVWTRWRSARQARTAIDPMEEWIRNIERQESGEVLPSAAGTGRYVRGVA